jgi:hypothetical protein
LFLKEKDYFEPPLHKGGEVVKKAAELLRW